MLVIMGSMSYDTINFNINGKRTTHTQPGGSLLYAAAGASKTSIPHCLGAYGSDFDQNMLLEMKKHCNLDGLKMIDGKTFRWECEYNGNERKDLGCHSGIAEKTKSYDIPDNYLDADVLMLCTEKPHIQYNMLKNFLKNGAIPIIVLDTILYCIENEREMLMKVIAESDVLSISEIEGFQLTGTTDLFECSKKLTGFGPDVVILKRAEKGLYVYDSINGIKQHIGPEPFIKLVDPTGAGDTFDGEFAARLDKKHDIINACIYGNKTAAKSVENIGVRF